MLEYTATIELSHQAVAKKYADKINLPYHSLRILDRWFFKDSIKLIQSDWDIKIGIA